MHRTRKIAVAVTLGGALLCTTLIGGCSLLLSVDGLTESATVDEASLEGSLADGADASSDADAATEEVAGDAGPDADAGKRARIFVIGGSEDGMSFPDVTPVRYAEIQDDGMLGPWQPGAPLPKPAMWHAAARGKDFIALVGGLTKPEGGNTMVVMGAVSGGLVASWFTSSPVLPAPRSHAGAVVRGSTLYVFGGVDDSGAKAEVWAGEVGPSTVAPFSLRSSLPTATARMGFAETDDAVFLVGGVDATNAVVASITKGTFLSDGGVRFTPEPPLPEARRYAAACVHDGMLFVVGGDATNDLPSVLVYPISAAGELGPHRTTTPLPYSRSRGRVVAHDHRIYVVGGRVGVGGDARDVLVGDLDPSGGVKSWRTTTPLPSTLMFHTVTLVP